MKEIPDLGESRDRHYPRRCKWCFLIESLCRCHKSAKIDLPKSGVRVRDPRRLRMAAWN